MSCLPSFGTLPKLNTFQSDYGDYSDFSLQHFLRHGTALRNFVFEYFDLQDFSDFVLLADKYPDEQFTVSIDNENIDCKPGPSFPDNLQIKYIRTNFNSL